LRKRQHNDAPIEVLEPEETRTVWVEATDEHPVVFHEPDFVEYYRFPDLRTRIAEPLQPANSFYWTLGRDADPKAL
jgi:hypothetical protein